MIAKYKKIKPYNCDGSNTCTVLLKKGNKVVIRINRYESEEQKRHLDEITKRIWGRDKPQHHLCGYVAIPKNKLPKEWWGNYDADALQYLNIHGGITYSDVVGGFCIFGFDCAHANDDENPDLFDPEYVMKLTEQMEEQILIYASVIHEWRTADTDKRLEALECIRGDNPQEFGMGAMIDMLGGGERIKNVK